ncbi:MAG: hypothetical protein H7A45_04015 [Verrucomicrobiales bacterium]|nr:hypothetical protein [Verrucomicrobiales bacterium]
MKGIEPIPSPARLRWREFRIRAVPWVVYLGAMAACVFIWVFHLAPPQLVGQVDIQQARINSTQPGRLATLRVARFDAVRTGDALAEVVVADPQVLESTLALIRAEVDLLRAQNDTVITRERAQVDYSRLRLESLDQRVQLASARARLQFAEAEAGRQEDLRRQPVAVVATSDYQRAANERDALQAEIDERTKLVAAIESDLAKFRAANPDHPDGDPAHILDAELALQESRIRLAEAELQPLTLTAPMDGVVSMIYCRAGENILAGELVLTITATQADRIHAFVMPPWRERPQVGMTLEVVRRSLRRETALAQVTHVGEHLDAVPANLLTLVNSRGLGLDNLAPTDAGGQPVELGLPVLLTLPPELGLLPGEMVDLRWVKAAGARPVLVN